MLLSLTMQVARKPVSLAGKGVLQLDHLQLYSTIRLTGRSAVGRPSRFSRLLRVVVEMNYRDM